MTDEAVMRTVEVTVRMRVPALVPDARVERTIWNVLGSRMPALGWEYGAMRVRGIGFADADAGDGEEAVYATGHRPPAKPGGGVG